MTQNTEQSAGKPAARGIRNAVISAGLLVALLILTVTAQLHPVLGKAGLDRLGEANEKYLDHSLQKALGTFAVLSAVKVGLAVVEGSEFGVGFGVGFGIEVGDAVQSAYDYVDLAWRAVLTSAAILLGTRYLLEAAGLLGPLFLSLLWITLLLGVLLRLLRPRAITPGRVLSDISLLLVILNLAIYVVLPVSVAGGHWLSERIIRQSTDEAEAGLTGLKSDLFPGNSQADGGLLDRLGQAKERLTAVAGYLGRKASEISVWLLRLIAGYLFDSLVFPLMLFVFLMWLTRTTARYVFHMQDRVILRDDLEQLFVRYYKRAHHPFEGNRL